MNDNTAVANKGCVAGGRRSEKIDVDLLPRAGGHLAELACEIADLAGGGILGVAGRLLTTTSRVEVSECGGARAICSNGMSVDVVDW